PPVNAIECSGYRSKTTPIPLVRACAIARPILAWSGIVVGEVSSQRSVSVTLLRPIVLAVGKNHEVSAGSAAPSSLTPTERPALADAPSASAASSASAQTMRLIGRSPFVSPPVHVVASASAVTQQGDALLPLRRCPQPRRRPASLGLAHRP